MASRMCYQYSQGLQPLIEPQADCEFIQILNCAGQHWVCISTIICRPHVVKVYDSMRTGDVPTSTKESIATLLNTSARTVYLVYPDVQQQTNRSSCRLFALAFAHTLCEGQDPSRITYCQDSLRSHFQGCLEKVIMSFESGRSPYNPGPFMKSRFKVYYIKCYHSLQLEHIHNHVIT